MCVNKLISFVFGLILMIGLTGSLAGINLFELYDGLPICFRFSYLHFGHYAYAAYPDEDSMNLFGGGFHEVGFLLEYRPWILFGIEIYGDFKGYYYEAYDGEPGYEQSENPFVRFWGNPNFSIGVGIVWHILGNIKQFDLSLSSGLEYVYYFASEEDYYPGIGSSIRIAGIWKPLPWFGIGIIGAAHYSIHAGGPKKSDPELDWYPFDLAELAVGLACSFYF